MRKRVINSALIVAAYLMTCVAVFTGSYFQEAISIAVGDVSDVRVVATRDVENILATQRNRDEARARADAEDPLLSTLLDPSLNELTINNLRAFFTRLTEIRRAYASWELAQDEEQNIAYAQWRHQVELWEAHLARVEQLEYGEETEIIGPTQPSDEFHFEITDTFPTEEHFNNFPVLLSLSQQEYLLSLSADELNELHAAIFEAAEIILDSPGIFEINPQVLVEVQRNISGLMNDVLDLGYTVLAASLVPNRVFDAEHFRARQQEIAENYEIVILRETELIVDANARITPEAYAIMEALGLLEGEWTRDIIPLTGIFIVIAFTMLACCWFIYFYRSRIISHTKEAMLLFTLYTCVLIFMWALDGASYHFMPILAFSMLIAMLMDMRTAVMLNLGLTVIAYFIVDGTMYYMLFFILAGTLVCLLARYTTERNKIVLVALLAACFNFVLSVAISLAFEPHQAIYSLNNVFTIAAFVAGNGVFAVIIAVGSLPLWEVLFGVVTPIKLLDLTNPTNPLMRRLTIEAPGTYHHSLIVANLAESAAYDIGANPHIARAGGYYHDIGKLKYPHYFAENITGVNPHDSIDPLSSAQIIVSHIAYGMTLAAEYRLPQFLRDIIYQHHGTALIKYFYCKAKDAEDPDDPTTIVNKNDYRYPFLNPQSRESAVVMLADGIEAAVRAIMAQGEDAGNLQEIIKKMIRDKLTDGTLADSELSIKDVDIIAKSFYRVLKGMYHERIPYPTEVRDESTEAAVINS